jgi:hypothetical protein
MSSNLEEQILNLIRSADLTEEELRYVDAQVAGYKIDHRLLEHTRRTIDVIKLNRSLVSYPNRPNMKASGPVDAKIAPDNAYHHSHSSVSCPHCYSTSGLNYHGDLVVDGCARPVHHCSSCNRLFSDVPSAVRTLLDAAIQNGAKSVGFVTPHVSGSDVNLNGSYNYQINDTNMKLDQVNSNISHLTTTVSGLLMKLEDLAQQNSKLMEQLAKDPLVHIKKSVAEFDLK